MACCIFAPVRCLKRRCNLQIDQTAIEAQIGQNQAKKDMERQREAQLGAGHTQARAHGSVGLWGGRGEEWLLRHG